MALPFATGQSRRRRRLTASVSAVLAARASDTRFRRCTDLPSCCHVYTRNTLTPCMSCVRTSAVRAASPAHRPSPRPALCVARHQSRFRPRAGRGARTRARAAWCRRRRAHLNCQRENAPGALHEFGHAKPAACDTGGCDRCELLQRAWHRQVCDSADLCRCAFEQHASVSEPIV